MCKISYIDKECELKAMQRGEGKKKLGEWM
jgi:hypothetical protein